jgi:hypothetical protein
MLGWLELKAVTARLRPGTQAQKVTGVAPEWQPEVLELPLAVPVLPGAGEEVPLHAAIRASAAAAASAVPIRVPDRVPSRVARRWFVRAVREAEDAHGCALQGVGLVLMIRCS